jgi:hypothetical protein
MTSMNSARVTGIGAPKYACGKHTTFEEVFVNQDFINEDGFALPSFCQECADNGIRTQIDLCDDICGKCNRELDEEELAAEGPDDSDDDVDSEEDERVDLDGGFIPRDEIEYIGVLPHKLTRKKLVKVMASALIAVQNDEFKYTGKRTSFDGDYWFEGALDLWFEHDDNGQYSSFAHLVPEDEMDDFYTDVRAEISRIQ